MSEPQSALSTNAVGEILKLPLELLAALDAWIGRQPEPRPSRTEAIYRVLAEALGVPDAGSIPAEDLNASNDE
jgi:hypothetical protein